MWEARAEKERSFKEATVIIQKKGDGSPIIGAAGKLVRSFWILHIVEVESQLMDWIWGVRKRGLMNNTMAFGWVTGGMELPLVTLGGPQGGALLGYRESFLRVHTGIKSHSIWHWVSSKRHHIIFIKLSLIPY